MSDVSWIDRLFLFWIHITKVMLYQESLIISSVTKVNFIEYLKKKSNKFLEMFIFCFVKLQN